jgi:hypothetical protein
MSLGQESLAVKFDPDEPRDEAGRWTDGGGGSDGGGARTHPGEGYSKHAWVDDKGVIHTSNVYDAQRALFEDRKVELKQLKQVSTLIQRLGETAAEMAEHGETAPVFNLCNVSIPGTNLFCAESKGIPRVEMPVIPAKRTKDFIKYLRSEGYKIKKDSERADHLRATQNEISGAKVAASMARIDKEGFYKRLAISREDYILDGHHTWAGQLGVDARDGSLKGDKHVKVYRIDISITKLLEEANKWTKEQGIVKKPASEAPKKDYAHISLREAAQLLDAETYQRFADVAYRFFAANGHLAQLDDVMITLPVMARAREREDTEIELWPEKGENEDDFMDRCVGELTICIGDRAETVCADKWESSLELGKKGFVTLSMLSGDLALAPCGTSCLGCRGTQTKFDPDEPRDEYGRWTTGGGGGGGGVSDGGGKFDVAKVEAKTKTNVEAAAKAALERGVKPLPGSQATHPNTIAPRVPTGKPKKGAARSPLVYGQPNLEAMKLDQERYEHGIDLFKNTEDYPNFRKDELSGTVDQNARTIIDHAKSNLKFLYGMADKSTTVWYDGARALVDDRAKLWGFNDASIAAVYAALSPTKDWDQNVHIGDMLMRVYKTQQDHRWDKKMEDTAKRVWLENTKPKTRERNQAIIDIVRGKTLGELTDPAEKGLWIRTYEEAYGSRQYRVVQPNGALGPLAKTKTGKPREVVWQSLPSLTMAVEALEANGDRDKISDTLAGAIGDQPAHKIRSFYNNILDPHAGNGDVTIDTHAVGAALLRPISNQSIPVLHNFGDAGSGNSKITGLGGTYPVYEQAYQEAAKELGIEPRQLQSAVWVVKRSMFTKKNKSELEAVWQEYQQDHKMTLAQVQTKVAAIMNRGSGASDEEDDEQRNYETDEEGGRRGDARELHRLRLSGRDGVDGGAGARAAGGSAGLESLRSERGGDGAEEVAWRDWDEGKHPRAPAGSPEGGQFTSEGGGSAPSGPAPKLPSVADVAPYKGRRDDVHPDDGKKIYDKRVDPQYLTKSPRLKDVTEVTSGLNKRGNYYQRQWGRRDAKGNLVIIEVDRKGRISSPDWFTLDKDPFEETVKLDRPEPRTPDEPRLLISEQPNQEKLDAWNKQLTDRQEELNQAGKTGEHEDDQLNGMQLALSAYSQEDQKNLDAERSGINVRYDLDNKLLAAAYTDIIHKPTGDVAKIAYFGALDPDAFMHVVNDITERFGQKVNLIEVQRWKDDPSLPLWEQAGFKQREGQAGLTNLSAVMLEKRFAPDAPSFEHSPVPVYVGEGTGGVFKSQLASGIAAIPPRTAEAIAGAGIMIRAGSRMTAQDMAPDLKGVHPRGWPAGTTWDSCEGMFNRGEKALYVTETYRPIGKKEFVPSRRIAGCLLHESGHALDAALDYPSANSKQFIEAYEEDVRRIPNSAKRGLRYFLQKGKAGRSETFAEVFSHHGMPGANGVDVRPFFPSVSQLVKNAMIRGVWLEGVGNVG